MQRDWLLGFPPVLLAQDACYDELSFPLGIPDRAYADYKSRPEYKRTRELMAFEMIKARPEITEADCRQVKPSVHTYGGIAGDDFPPLVRLDYDEAKNSVMVFDAKALRWEILATLAPVSVQGQSMGAARATASEEVAPIAQPESVAAATTPAGVWRKTAEHKPPKVGEYKTRMGEDDKPINGWSWDGERWFHGDFSSSATGKWQWLDTSGKFKVGDRVRVKDGVVSAFCKPGMVGVVVVGWNDGALWFRADGAEHNFCATGWLEHA